MGRSDVDSPVPGSHRDVPAAAVQSWPMVGRAGLVRDLRSILLGDRNSGVMLAGTSGVGKTRLAAEVLAVADRSGIVTVRTSATEACAEIPLGAFAPLLPETGVGAVDDRADLFHRCTTALAERAGGGRLVLMVDDAHLLDRLSATLLHQIAQTPGIRLLVTVRSGERAPDPVVSLWKDGLVVRQEVPELGEDAVGEALSWVLGGPVDDVAVAELAGRSGGNMFFLRELVIGALGSGALEDAGGVWRLSDHRPSDRLVELVEVRLAGLTPAERALMEVVSLGEPLGVHELAALDQLENAEELERRGLLASRTEEGRLSVSLDHPLYGEVLRNGIPALRARSIVRSLADAVERAGGSSREDLLRVANWRLIGGGAEPAGLYEAALVARWRYDFPLAERLARACVERGGGFEAELLLSQLAAIQGRPAEARNRLQQLAGVAATDEQRARIALSRLDNRIIYEGSIAEGLAVADTAERELAGTEWVDEIRARRVALLLASEGPGAAAASARPLLARATGRALVWASMPGSYSLARSGSIEEALDAARRGQEAHLALSEPMDWYPTMHVFYQAEALTHSGRVEEAAQLASAEYRAAVEARSVEAQALHAWQLMKGVADRGDVDEAIRLAHTAVAIYRQLGRPQFVEFGLLYLAIALGVGGRGEDAREVLRAHDDLGVVTSFFMGVDLDLARGWADVAGGHLRSGGDRFRAAAVEGERIGDLVGAATALHDLARIGLAGEAIDSLERIAPRVEGALCAARARHARGLVDHDAELLEQVGEEFADMGTHLLAAEALAHAATEWRRAGRNRRAATAEQRVAQQAARCPGAATPALQGARPRAALTRAELEAARLAAAGLSNRQIAARLEVSVRTVENRLQQVYGKLGVDGRPGLSEALATLDEG